ncbi:MAG: DUF6600 domain-containing protein [bacterium]
MNNIFQPSRLVSFYSQVMVVTLLTFLILAYPGFPQTDISLSVSGNSDTDYDNDIGNNNVGYFYDSLLPYGQWVLMPDNTWAWIPYDMPVDWRPYTLGHWVYTDYGWTWVSDEPWGWACFHYGRWDYDNDYGWAWYPGRVWGPAWVVWRYNDDWIGWAPCPRQLHWRDDRGFDLKKFNIQIMIASHNFCFVPTRHIFDNDLHRQIMPVTWNTRVVNITKPDMRYTIDNHRIINQMPVEPSRLENIIGHPILKLNLIAANQPTNKVIIQNHDNTIQLYKPDFQTIAPTEHQRRFPNIPNISTPIKSAPTTSQQKSRLRNLLSSQEAENRALQQKHLVEQKALHEQHQREMALPSITFPREQLQQQHQAENQALQEQMQREQRLLQNYHDRENMIRTAPAAPSERRFEINPSQSKEQYQRMQQYEKEQRNRESTSNMLKH